MLVSLLAAATSASPSLNYLEVYNQSSSPISLDGWSFAFTYKDASACAVGRTQTVNFPSGWILPKHYLTFDSTVSKDPAQSATFSVGPGLLTGCTSPWLSELELDQNDSAEQTMTIPQGAALDAGVKQTQRDNSPNSTRTLTGTFGTDYVPLGKADTNLFSDALYSPPATALGLKIVEVLPNSESCPPLDAGLSCSDFVKLYNSSGSPVDLSNYRLRTSYDGTKSTSSNTISLSGLLNGGQYTIVNTKNDGSPISLTDTGGYVWLEDALGAATYQPIVQYPDASSAAKIGWAWALGSVDWQWSSEPTAGANVFPVVEATDSSPLSTVSSLSLCAPNQFRNPATNRCKLIATNSQSLVACASNQERNPATNRCRAVLAASTSLGSCPAGQTRNPATNRCRKDPSATVASIKDIKSPTKTATSSLKWLLILLAVAVALGYAVYEWRQEMLLAFQKAKAKSIAKFKK